MRVLIVADNASRRFGGEALIPLNYFRLLRRRGIDVRLLVHERTKAELIELLPEDRDRLHFVQDTTLHKIAFHVGKYLPRRISETTTGLLIHLSTQYAQKLAVRSVPELEDVDVIHVPIPVSPKTPSCLYGLPAPIVVGPLNGGMEYPEAFRGGESRLTRLVVFLGRKLSNGANRLIPGKRRAKLILVANRRTRYALPLDLQDRTIELVENGVDFTVWRRGRAAAPKSSGIKFVFIGRLIDWKALDIVLEALKRMRRQSDVKLQIIGDGPMLKAWQALSRDMGLGDKVTFTGWMPQEACAVELEQSDALLLPSIYECGGAVVLEAMAMGLPVIATAWGGPLDYLDDTCGFLIPPNSRESMIAGFASAMDAIANSEALRKQMGQAGLERARRDFDWENKITRIIELYRLAIDASSAKQPTN